MRIPNATEITPDEPVQPHRKEFNCKRAWRGVVKAPDANPKLTDLVFQDLAKGIPL